MVQIEKWDIFEVEIKGKSDGNPFVDYWIQGTFTGKQETVTVDGFYDGDGVYKVRFMPSHEGTYHYAVKGNCIDDKSMQLEGEFTVTPAVSPYNHGPVRVLDKMHLVYEDNTPYYSMGTTCYAWVNQSMELQEQTLETLEQAPFNKIRFCVFPKFYLFNEKEPITYPYERGQGEGIDPALVKKDKEEHIYFPGMAAAELDMKFDYYRPNVEHFKRFDLRIRQLRDMGIEADLILMHPYDRWGVNLMNRECCDLYLKYVNARFGAYRNIWWSLANEYDLINTKSIEDWERYGTYLAEHDPYRHLCSVHNCMEFYDYSKPWVSHCSAQRVDFYRHVEYTDEYLEKWEKPVVWDEICYEGNIELGWGNITAQEMVRRFWEAALRGGHPGHGETYLDENDILWWSHGGKLKGESAPRIQFLLDILKETPGRYLHHGDGMFDECVGIPEGQEKKGMFIAPICDYELHYFGIMQPAYRTFYLPEDEQYEIDVIDTWEMTVTKTGIHSGVARIDLPQHQWMAVRLRKV